jgi:hypothetical protein
MTSTTTSKKEIADFLWEWAERHGDWGKILINKVVSTENTLHVCSLTKVDFWG